MATIIACDRCGEINIKPVGDRTVVAGQDQFAVQMEVKKNTTAHPTAEVCRVCFAKLVYEALYSMHDKKVPA